jgi:hypothetical protein
MLPSAHYKGVGVRIASFRRSIAHPTYSPVYASLLPTPTELRHRAMLSLQLHSYNKIFHLDRSHRVEG